MSTARPLPSPHPAVVHRRVGDGVVLLDPASETYFGLKGVGAAIWDGLAGGADTVEGLVAQLTARWPEAGAERIAADLEALLADLSAAGLVVPAPQPAGVG